MEKFFLGTYTKRLSKGIYSFDFDVNTGEPSRLKLVGTAGNPTYLAMGNNNLIYCIDNSSQYSLNNGGIKVFDVSQNPAKIVYHLHDAPISGAYISFDKNTRRLFTANYHANQLSMYRVNQSSCTLLDRIDDIGEVGPEKEQKDGPHPHFINLTPEGRVVVCDLGLDKIFIYDISNKNRLELKTTFTLPAGFGPRHIRFDLKRKVSYVVGELSSNVATLKYDEKSGIFGLIQITHTIPAWWNRYNGAAAIRISKDFKNLYVTNRGYNSVAVFEIHEHGYLKLIQNVECGGDFPRDLKFSLDDRFALVANQKSDNLSVFKRQKASGLLELVNNNFKVPEPTAIVALK